MKEDNLTSELRNLKNIESSKYSKIFEIVQSGILIADLLTSTILEVNDSFIFISGFSKLELLGNKLIDIELLSNNVWSQINDEIEKYGAIKNLEFEITKKNLKKATIVLNAELLINSQGTKQVLASINEISDSKRTENLLKYQDKYLLQILNSVSDHVLVQNVNNKLTWANHSFMEFNNLFHENQSKFDSLLLNDKFYVENQDNNSVLKSHDSKSTVNLISIPIVNENDEINQIVHIVNNSIHKSSLDNIKNLADYLPIGIILTDSNYKITVFNKISESITSYINSSAIGLKLEDLDLNLKSLDEKIINFKHFIKQDVIKNYNEEKLFTLQIINKVNQEKIINFKVFKYQIVEDGLLILISDSNDNILNKKSL